MNRQPEIRAVLLMSLGDHLTVAGVSVAIVVVGGASLVLTGLIERATKDIDIIAQVDESNGSAMPLPAVPLPPAMEEAIRTVARDFALPADWMNTQVGAQWQAGLPPDLLVGAVRRQYGRLTVYFAARAGLIPLKLFATIDSGPESKHYQDLLALAPTDEETDRAADWVRGQDVGEHFEQLMEQAVERLRTDLGSNR